MLLSLTTLRFHLSFSPSRLSLPSHLGKVDDARLVRDRDQGLFLAWMRNFMYVMTRSGLSFFPFFLTVGSPVWFASPSIEQSTALAHSKDSLGLRPVLSLDWRRIVIVLLTCSKTHQQRPEGRT